MPLSPGDPAPAVSAPNQHGETVAVDGTDPAVVYFYPEDDTPGCSIEAEQFQRELRTYRDAGVAVYGVSTDEVESHRAFADDRGVEFDLLADPDGDVADAFGLDLRQGRAPRTTFVLADGEVWAVHEGVDPDGHAREVLGAMLDAGLVDLED